MINVGFSREVLGFSNSRMAYDDVISKFLLTLEFSTLQKKVTANTVTARYRDKVGFDFKLIDSTKNVLSLLYECLIAENSTKLNKASMLSWMIFIYTHQQYGFEKKSLKNFFVYFEKIKKESLIGGDICNVPVGLNKELIKSIFSIYQDRSSSRVADTSSVVLRDLALWSMFVVHYPDVIKNRGVLNKLYKSIYHLATMRPSDVSEKIFETVANSIAWGRVC